MLLIAPIEIRKVLLNIISTIRTECANVESGDLDKEESILFQFFGDRNYLSASTLFTRGESTGKKVEVRSAFDQSRANVPTIHITFPGEQEHSQNIGVNEQYNNDDIQFTRMFNGNINLVFTSDNTDEVTFMYLTVRTMLLCYISHLELVGLQNVKISGQDVSLSTDTMPPNIYVTMLGISYTNVVCVSKKLANTIITNLFVEPTLIEHD